jgi:hypothetical protein
MPPCLDRLQDSFRVIPHKKTVKFEKKPFQLKVTEFTTQQSRHVTPRHVTPRYVTKSQQITLNTADPGSGSKDKVFLSLKITKNTVKVAPQTKDRGSGSGITGWKRSTRPLGKCFLRQPVYLAG